MKYIARYGAAFVCGMATVTFITSSLCLFIDLWDELPREFLLSAQLISAFIAVVCAWISYNMSERMKNKENKLER
jgi:hypothetical protein